MKTTGACLCGVCVHCHSILDLQLVSVCWRMFALFTTVGQLKFRSWTWACEKCTRHERLLKGGQALTTIHSVVLSEGFPPRFRNSGLQDFELILCISVCLCLYWICVSLYFYRVLLLLKYYHELRATGGLLGLSAASQWTCSETVYLCWKEETPFQRCLFGSVFPVALCPLWELLCWGSIPWPLTLSLCWHNGPFVPTYTAAVGPCLVFSAIIHNPSPAMPLVAASLERNAIESRRNAVKRGRGLQELDCGADKFHIERVNMFLSCYPACTLTHGVWRRWRRA